MTVYGKENFFSRAASKNDTEKDGTQTTDSIGPTKGGYFKGHSN